MCVILLSKQSEVDVWIMIRARMEEHVLTRATLSLVFVLTSGQERTVNQVGFGSNLF